MTNELTPVRCGCGGEAKIQTDHDTVVPGEPIDWKRVVCDNCNIRTTWRKTEAEAIQAWNRAMGTDIRTLMKVFAYDAMCAVCKKKKKRTAKVEEVEKPNVFKCSVCGQYFHSTAWGSPVEYCSRCGAKLDWSGNETD